jgi:hypothetical protein
MSHRTHRLVAITLIALLIGSFVPSGMDSLAASSFTFAMVPSAGAASCLPGAAGSVNVNSIGPVEVMDVSLSGLPANTDFDFFVTQLPTAPFGVSGYQGDIETDGTGHGSQRFIGRFSLETFAVAPGSGAAPVVHNGPFPDASTNPPFNPIHMFHLGLWFNSPTDAQAAGCPATVTPFNGDHTAGIQVLNTRTFPDAQGPLRHVDTSTPAATPIDNFNSATQTLKFDITRSAGVVGANCLPNAIGHVTVRAVGPVEVMDVAVSGMPPNKDFDFFVIQLPNAPFGESWYQGDLETDGNGNGSQRYIGRFSVETFLVAPGSGAAPVVHIGPFPDASTNPQFSPVHTFHAGLWFNSPTDAQAAGCPATVTPFNGDHTAGIQVLSSRSFRDTEGPLSCLPRPNVRLQTSQIGPGQIRGTLTAARTAAHPNNDLTQLQITRLDNTTILVNGTPATPGQTVTLPAGTTSAQVVLTRIARGAFTARLAVTDGCGAWPTFLGGGSAVS